MFCRHTMWCTMAAGCTLLNQLLLTLLLTCDCDCLASPDGAHLFFVSQYGLVEPADRYPYIYYTTTLGVISGRKHKKHQRVNSYIHQARSVGTRVHDNEESKINDEKRSGSVRKQCIVIEDILHSCQQGYRLCSLLPAASSTRWTTNENYLRTIFRFDNGTHHPPTFLH